MEEKLIEIEENDLIEEYSNCYVIHSNKYISNKIFFDQLISRKYLLLEKQNSNVFTKF